MPAKTSVNVAALLQTLALTLTLNLSSAPSFAGETAAVGEGDKMDAILQELKAIRQVLETIQKQGVNQAAQRPPRPTTASVPVDGKPVLGSDTAPVTVVEFTDYQCPYCLRFTMTTFPTLRKEFIDTGKVRWVALNLPLEFHPNARKAAQAALCAGEQDKFWEMRLELFKHPKQLAEQYLPGYATTLGLDLDDFNDCLASERHLAAIDKDAEDAKSVRLTGTPSFIVGKTATDKITGRVIIGAQSVESFSKAIDKLLDENAGAKTETPAKRTDGGA